MRTPPAPSSDPKSRPGSRALVLIVAALLCVATPGRAEPPAPASRSAIEVVLVGAIGEDPAFTRRVTSWFDPERYRVAVRRIPRLDPSSILSPRRDGAVYVWVLLWDPHHARLYFACASGSGSEQPIYLWRDLALPAGLDEVGAENIAQVLHLSTVALLEGQAGNQREEVERALREEPTSAARAEPSAEPSAEPGVEPSAEPGVEPAAEPSTEPPTSPRRAPAERSARRGAGAPERAPRLGAELGLGYGASLRGDEGLWHGPRVSSALRGPSGWGLRAAAESALPTSRELGPLALEFYGALVTFTGSYRRALGRSVALEWSAGPGVEVVHYRPARSLEPTVTAGSGDTEARPGVVAGMSGVFRPSSPRIAVNAQGLVPLERTHYDVVTGEERRVIGRAAPVIPSLGVEARF